MEFLKNLNVKQMSVLKMVGIGLGALVVLAVGFNVFGSVIRGLNGSRIGSVVPSMAPQGLAYGLADKFEEAGGSVGLSVRNVAPMPPMEPRPTTGNDAEQFEVTSYSGSIETRDLDKTCGSIQALKGLSYVIFENVANFKHGCNFTFKVEKVHAEEILAKIQALNPKELSQDTHTIKKLVDDYTSEEDILKKKKQSIEETLEGALKAYTDITSLATKTQDADTLARVIESKLQTLERLTQERINVNEQLDRLGRAKAEQLDRLEYTYFTLNVMESKFVDGEFLRDSWKQAVREFVENMNGLAQDLSIRLVTTVFAAMLYLAYFFLGLVIVKYAWKWTKAIWQK